MNLQSALLQRQAPLRAAYVKHPEKARIVKRARSALAPGQDCVHGIVAPGDYGVQWSWGIDRAVGGFHDAPNPAEMLCAALAACQLGTVLMVADVLGVGLEAVDVEVVGEVDVRGALSVDRSVPVGFQSMRCTVRMDVAPGTAPEARRRLVAEAERSCINVQTLRAGLPVDVAFVEEDEVVAAR